MIELKKNEEQLTNEVMSKINLSKDKTNLENHVVNLSKTLVNLSKKVNVDLGDVKAQVVLVLDYSASMEFKHLYTKGVVQDTINKLVPVGLTFDDNGEIDTYLFENGYRKFPNIDINNYDGYVNDVILKSSYKMGGTNYAPVLDKIIFGDTESKPKGVISKLFRKKSDSSALPAGVGTDIKFIMFITDGDNGDKQATRDLIIESSKTKKDFIQFIGIGDDSFRFLEELDDIEGREYDNTGFSRVKSLENVNDQDLYNKLLEQFVEWLKTIKD